MKDLRDLKDLTMHDVQPHVTIHPPGHALGARIHALGAFTARGHALGTFDLHAHRTHSQTEGRINAG